MLDRLAPLAHLLRMLGRRWTASRMCSCSHRVIRAMIPFIAEVKFLAQSVPRVCHRKQLRLGFGRIYGLGKPKVVLGLSTKPMRHGSLPILGRNALTSGLFLMTGRREWLMAELAEFPRSYSVGMLAPG
jgi:hypothetical protein